MQPIQHKNTNDSWNRQIAAGVTFLVCCLLLIWLFVAKLGLTQAQRLVAEERPFVSMVSEDEEFIDVEVLKPTVVGEDFTPAQTPQDMDNESQPAPETGVDLTSQGLQGQPVKTVTQQRPSPLKEQPKTTTSKPETAVDKKAEEEKALAARTQSNITNAFANAQNKNNAQNGTKDEANAGRANGNPASGASPKSTGSRPGVSGTVGGGWKMPAYSRDIPSSEVGKVVFEVAVNRDGSVGKITQIDASGLTSSTIARCRNEISRHKFTHPNPDEAQPTTARVTFTFVDPS